MAEHPNAALIRKGYQAFAAGDMATLSELFTQDVQWHEAGGATTPIAGDYKGQEAVFGLFGRLVQLTNEFQVTLEEVVADEHQAVAIHEVYARRGTTTYRCREAIVFHLLDGKVTDAWHTVPDAEAYDMFWAATLDMTTVEQNLANARRGYEAFAAGDLATLTELFADDVAWHVNSGSPHDGTYVGREQVFGYFAQLTQDLQGSLDIEIHDILANEDHVTALCNVTATRNGTAFTDQLVQVMHMRGGQVTECFTATCSPERTLEFWRD